MDGLVHQSLDEVALVSCVTHRAKIEHEFHDVEVGSVACSSQVFADTRICPRVEPVLARVRTTLNVRPLMSMS